MLTRLQLIIQKALRGSKKRVLLIKYLDMTALVTEIRWQWKVLTICILTHKVTKLS